MRRMKIAAGCSGKCGARAFVESPRRYLRAASRLSAVVNGRRCRSATFWSARVTALSRPARPPPSEAVRASADHRFRCQREGARFSISVCLAQHQPASSEVDTSGPALAQKARRL